MRLLYSSWRAPALVGMGALLLTCPASTQAQRRPTQYLPADRSASSRPTPKLEPVAETRLLMEGLNQANFRGLAQLLAKKPADGEAWGFARGQALLIAETGNLLLLRPPRQAGQSEWMDMAMDMRTAATRLARAAGKQDYEHCRTSLSELATRCNRCHETFRVDVRIAP